MHVNKQQADREQRFMELLKPCQQGAERYALSLVGDRDAAKDVLQDTIIIVWRKFDDLKDPAAFKSYLFTILTNLVRRQYRKTKHFVALSDEHAQVLEDTTPSPDTSAESALVREAINKLPEKSREAVILYEIEDMSVKDIAKIQRSSVSAVKVRLFRARKQLMKMLNIGDESDETSRPSPASLLV